MDEQKHRSRHFDTQAFLFRSITQILIIIGIGILIKFAFVDAFKMSGTQMSPTILSGDRLLVFRTPYLPVFNAIFKPALKKPVIFRMPSDRKNIGCLRIVGFSADTISIDSGNIINSRDTSLILPITKNSDQILPEDFSPRDYFKNFRIPASGDTLKIDSFEIRDFFFSYSMIQQENPETKISFKPKLQIDDSIVNDYEIKGFTLYEGTINSVPQRLKEDWFFWCRLEHYLKQLNQQKSVSLTFELVSNDTMVHRYTVKDNYVFLIADNWASGFDSRYFGPVRSSAIIGRTFSVLWSFEQKSGKKSQIRLNRFGRIIK